MTRDHPAPSAAALAQEREAIIAAVRLLEQAERKDFKSGAMPGLCAAGYVAAITDVLALLRPHVDYVDAEVIERQSDEPPSDLHATEGPWSGGFAKNH